MTASTRLLTTALYLQVVHIEASVFFKIHDNAYCAATDVDLRKGFGRIDTIQQCASMVKANPECSKTFYGRDGACACVRAGKTCEVAPSNQGNMVYVVESAYCDTLDESYCASGDLIDLAAITECAGGACHAVDIATCCKVCPIMENVDTAGRDELRTLKDVSSSSECQQHCSVEQNCESWTYFKKPSHGSYQDCVLIANVPKSMPKHDYSDHGRKRCRTRIVKASDGRRVVISGASLMAAAAATFA